MERLSRLVYDRCVLPVARCLVTYGSYWVHIPPVESDAGPRPAPGATLTDPAAGHPERLRPDIPLSALERELSRVLGAPR